MANEGSQEEFVILDTTVLTGVQSVSFSQNTSEDQIVLLGNEFGGTNVNNPTATSVNISKSLVNNDIITTLTGKAISGQFIYGDNILAFSTGFIQNYSLSANVGEIPKIDCEIEIFGDLSGTHMDESRLYGGPSNDTVLESGVVEIPQTGIQVTIDKSSLNSVQSIVYTEEYSHDPIYTVGSLVPQVITNTLPVAQQIDVGFDVEEYTMESKTGSLATTTNRNRDISLEIFDTTGRLQNFELYKGHLVSESLNTDVANGARANISYRGYKKKT